MKDKLTGKTFFGRILEGVRYRLGNKSKKNNNDILSSFKKKIIKHQPPNVLRHVDLDGSLFYYTKPAEFYQCYKEIFESSHYDIKFEHPAPVIIDCGANIGLGVLFIKRKYPGAIITAFEPDANNYDLLKRNLERFDNIILEQKAIWINNGEISFSQTGTMGSSIQVSASDHLDKVQCVRLSDLLNKTIDFLKIDIEGAEYEVLKDCAGHLANVKNLFVEYHGRVNEANKLVEILSIIKNAGYSVYIKSANDLIEYPFITKTIPEVNFEVQLNIFCYRLDGGDI